MMIKGMLCMLHNEEVVHKWNALPRKCYRNSNEITEQVLKEAI